MRLRYKTKQDLYVVAWTTRIMQYLKVTMLLINLAFNGCALMSAGYEDNVHLQQQVEEGGLYQAARLGDVLALQERIEALQVRGISKEQLKLVFCAARRAAQKTSLIGKYR